MIEHRASGGMERSADGFEIKWSDSGLKQNTLYKKGNWYLARMPELDFISRGRTPEEVKKNLWNRVNKDSQRNLIA